MSTDFSVAEENGAAGPASLEQKSAGETRAMRMCALALVLGFVVIIVSGLLLILS
jgi:hypothetical protein